MILAGLGFDGAIAGATPIVNRFADPAGGRGLRVCSQSSSCCTKPVRGFWRRYVSRRWRGWWFTIPRGRLTGEHRAGNRRRGIAPSAV